MMEQEKIRRLGQMLAKAKHIACLTGAGMSTESGIPDFRSTQGLYRTLTSEEVFDINLFNRSPERFYQVIGPLYEAILAAQPNGGHLALAELCSRCGKTVTVATQNIDGLHQKAGSPVVWEVHGTMATLSCRKCGATEPCEAFREELKTGKVLRHSCGGVFKPDITFYGENLPEKPYISSLNAMRQADLVLVLGTSLVVYPAAGLPSYRRPDAPLVIINRTATEQDSEAALVFHDSIGEVLPAAVAQCS